MRPSLNWAFPLLLIFVLITAVPAGQAGNSPPESPLLPVEAAATVPTSGQVSTAGAGAEPIVLAAARSLPTGVETPRPKKPRKAKGPAEGSGCEGGKLQEGTGEDIVIDSSCTVGAGTYHYGFVNIVNGGTLNFKDQTIDFWAKSILVENEGSLIVGSPTDPIGNKKPGNVVTFHLYGDDNQPAGITCKTTNCGVGPDNWIDDPQKKITLPSGVKDYFYKYQRLPVDDSTTGGLATESYFGLKTLAVSYGGSLQMFGQKGAEYNDVNPHDDAPGMKSGQSWVRLNESAAADTKDLVLDRKVNTWQAGDWIVVTATDYIPNHSEMRQIKSVATSGDHSVITLETTLSYPHNGEKYDLAKHQIPDRLNIDKEEKEDYMTSVDTRAAVALLTRSIRIVSEGAAFNQPFPSPEDSSTGRYFGGHVIARQGFKVFQMKGVELMQLGQGGRMAHSPINFHLARQVPTSDNSKPGTLSTYVTACSVNESMTRMYEIRGTQGVTLKGNVGYKSIGHGYFLAEGTETGNKLVANIGIYARPAVDYRDNQRKVPGIMAKQIFYKYKDKDGVEHEDPDRANYGAFGSDYIHPSVFYITNAYNTFEDNMAVGAGTCGACYWIAPVRISGLSRDQSWESYAGIQRITNGTAPLYRFHGNFCSTAQYSLITIDSPGVCNGVQTPNMPPDDHALQPISNPFELNYKAYSKDLTYRGRYPDLDVGSFLQTMKCDTKDCANFGPTCGKGKTANCTVNVIDSYTSSFHWAQQNFSAIWLRTFWFLFTNSALTDVLNGGLTMVSGGSWDQVPNRYWAVTRKSVFIGQTQDDNKNLYAQDRGPVNPDTHSQLVCMSGTPGAYCRVQDGTGKDEGIVIPTDNFSVYQRLYNIYDGPVYQEANAYVHIKKREVTGCNDLGEVCDGTPNFLYWRTPGIPKATENPLKDKCVMPNAAIGWKQPNGFYYPPAFHSRNLFFDDVDLRHFVIVPLFKPGTFEVDVPALKKSYCTRPGNAEELFSTTFTDIDRQTELNDDDGSLSGLKGADPIQISETNGTVSVNKDQFYYAPKSPYECLSEQSCYQSPYDYMSFVVYPGLSDKGEHDPNNPRNHWSLNADGVLCHGVPLYRQYLNDGEDPGVAQGIKMMGAATGQRSTMIANNGKYYIDTTVSAAKQYGEGKKFVSEFLANHDYYFFLIYAKPTTNVTFQLYVGRNLPKVTFDVETHVRMIRAGTNNNPNNTNKLDNATVLTYPLHCDNMTLPWDDNWTRTYDSKTGILEVTMNLKGHKNLFDDARKESCGPPSFCAWQDGKCGCVKYDDPKNNPIGYSCDDTHSKICEWSSYRSECPSGGCFGFKVVFPTGFVADDNASHRPETHPFPDSWATPRLKWDKASQGDCWDPAWKDGTYDPVVYPVGPCFYSSDEQQPVNAPLPTATVAESSDE